MTQTNPFTPRLLSASEYVLALHRPEDRVALLLRNRLRGQTMQRILAAQAVASPAVQDWLRERSGSGADMYVTWNRTGVCSSFCRQLGSARLHRAEWSSLGGAHAALRTTMGALPGHGWL